jgi:hypothetical protein
LLGNRSGKDEARNSGFLVLELEPPTGVMESPCLVDTDNPPKVVIPVIALNIRNRRRKTENLWQICGKELALEEDTGIACGLWEFAPFRGGSLASQRKG